MHLWNVTTAQFSRYQKVQHQPSAYAFLAHLFLVCSYRRGPLRPMFGTGQSIHPTHLPTHYGRKAHAGCNLHRWRNRDRLQHRHRGSPNLLLPALCPGMGCDHHDRIVHQSTGPVRGHGRQQHCHRSLHPDHSHSDGGQAENPAAAEDWIGIHVCRGILVSVLSRSATPELEELTVLP